MGIFGMSSYPYSFKLLWSPIVDSVFSPKVGRRKSWIVPIQLLSAAVLVLSSKWIEERFEAADVLPLTALFFVFVLLAATQVGGCAVDCGVWRGRGQLSVWRLPGVGVWRERAWGLQHIVCLTSCS